MLSIKYIVKYYPHQIYKTAKRVLVIGCVILFLCSLVFFPGNYLPLEQQLLFDHLVHQLLPKSYYIIFDSGFMLSLSAFIIMKMFQWRKGSIDVNEEMIIINGSMKISIRLKNLILLEFVYKPNGDRKLMIDSKTDAVEIKFKNEKEFDEFRSFLLKQIEPYEDQIKIEFI